MLLGKSDAFTLNPSARKGDHELVYTNQINNKKRFLVIDRRKLTVALEQSEFGWYDGTQRFALPKYKIHDIVKKEPYVLVMHTLLNREKECVLAGDFTTT